MSTINKLPNFVTLPVISSQSNLLYWNSDLGVFHRYFGIGSNHQVYIEIPNNPLVVAKNALAYLERETLNECIERIIQVPIEVTPNGYKELCAITDNATVIRTLFSGLYHKDMVVEFEKMVNAFNEAKPISREQELSDFKNEDFVDEIIGDVEELCLRILRNGQEEYMVTGSFKPDGADFKLALQHYSLNKHYGLRVLLKLLKDR